MDPTRLLLTFNVSVNLGDKYHKNTALHWAVLAGNSTVISLLLDANANVDAQNIKVEPYRACFAISFRRMLLWMGGKNGWVLCYRVKHRSISSSKGRTCGWSTTCRKRGRLKATTARPTWRGWRWTRCIHKHKLRYVSVYIKRLKTRDMMWGFVLFFLFQWPKHSHLSSNRLNFSPLLCRDMFEVVKTFAHFQLFTAFQVLSQNIRPMGGSVWGGASLMIGCIHHYA